MAKWLRILCEMGVFLAVVIPVNVSLSPPDPAFRSAQPHLSLIGIALMATFSGLLEGLLRGSR